jgi:hypothetical protein
MPEMMPVESVNQLKSDSRKIMISDKMRKESPSERTYRLSAQWLCKANLASEKGQKKKAEELYLKSSYWLMRYNDIVEKAWRKEGGK